MAHGKLSNSLILKSLILCLETDWTLFFNSLIHYFKNSLMPSQFIQGYSNMFKYNQLRFDMLEDMDDSLLKEIGILPIDQSLSVLKHAKKIISQASQVY